MLPEMEPRTAWIRNCADNCTRAVARSKVKDLSAEVGLRKRTRAVLLQMKFCAYQKRASLLLIPLPV